jgi:hypothetical protein
LALDARSTNLRQSLPLRSRKKGATRTGKSISVSL